MEVHILFAKVSWLLLIVILCIRPLADITKKKFFYKVLPYRKHLGIICGFLAILHVIIYIIQKNLFSTYFGDAVFWRLDNLFGWGNLALFALTVPFITSSFYFQKKLKRKWKTLQNFSYAAIIFTGIHVAFVKNSFIGGLAPVFLWGFLWLWAEKTKNVIDK